MLNHKRWSAVLLLSIFSLTLSLPVVAQSITEQGTAQNTRVYLPYVSTTNVSQSSMDTPDALIQLLNQRFANTGIRFFVFDPSGDVVKASSSDGIELPTFKKTDVLQVPSKEALIETVDSVYLGTQDLDAILSLESSYPDTTLQAASLTQRSQTVSWYEAACGG